MKQKITFSINIYDINESLVMGANDMVHFVHMFVDSELSAVFVAISVFFQFQGRKEIFGTAH